MDDGWTQEGTDVPAGVSERPQGDGGGQGPRAPIPTRYVTLEEGLADQGFVLSPPTQAAPRDGLPDGGPADAGPRAADAGAFGLDVPSGEVASGPAPPVDEDDDWALDDSDAPILEEALAARTFVRPDEEAMAPGAVDPPASARGVVTDAPGEPSDVLLPPGIPAGWDDPWAPGPPVLPTRSPATSSPEPPRDLARRIRIHSLPR